MHEKASAELILELRDVKLLLVLQLLERGVRQKQIASMLGISEATMSRMVPKGAAFAKGDTREA